MLETEPEILDRARARVRQWLTSGEVARKYAQSWRDILDQPTRQIEEAIVSPDESSRALRQVSPFAGAVSPRARWRIWREERKKASL